MKHLLKYIAVLALVTGWWACQKEGNYPGSQINPYLPMFDLRGVYQGKDVKLSKETMFGCDKITGVVISDHAGMNLPEGLLIIQDYRRLNLLRGMSIDLGADAASYAVGDSVVVDVNGGTLTRKNGILQITGLTKNNITKVSSNNTIPRIRVNSDLILNKPGDYESVLSVVVKGTFVPVPAAGETFAGTRVLNDGFGNLPLVTNTGATFAGATLPGMANYTGIVFRKEDDTPELRMRTGSDYEVFNASLTLQPILITGFLNDPTANPTSDANYEYVQFKATQDINFAVTPYSMVVSNNAGASNPTGAPAQGWATGVQRTYKINIASGTVQKGQFFYVGGRFKLINGPNSTDIAAANWVVNYDYAAKAGEGFGSAKTNLMANSGNAFGIAVFAGVTVTAASVPVDVIHVGGGGSLYAAPSSGYRICNNDWYDIQNPLEPSVQQPFFRMGTNNIFLGYNADDAGAFVMLGGEYSTSLRKWTKVRTQRNIFPGKTGLLTDIQSDSLSTKIVE
ncbi:DUF5689 domain-containing protein [Chitinophaga sedimenti]|uniref:DUF5689 domain-containing protein n=1 Tax=Chitinophaga sedimenti TaxID=2033606 RepID=UPI002002B05E|nr:DUF5689 domain-containing protein [Chitinophaga sedimenti]MCK7559856.1 DUF5689 domain-containing protein [Chitinophaga sedimenti]